MSVAEKQILSLVATLTPEERLRIIHAILYTLEEKPGNGEISINPADLEIAQKRSREFEEGKVKVMTREEFWGSLKKRQEGK
ncbi:MAG: addiction module protein [Bacteroidia bacterium]|nr:addiction module protein [Bacteroidia bacterium]